MSRSSTITRRISRSVRTERSDVMAGKVFSSNLSKIRRLPKGKMIAVEKPSGYNDVRHNQLVSSLREQACKFGITVVTINDKYVFLVKPA